MDALEKLVQQLMDNADQRKDLLDRLWILEDQNQKLREKLLAMLKIQRLKP